ncbi:MAG: hypothetical protein KDA38_08390, partial [Planctomycetales bacterium]|nr:hypothetical protein [Planctomycetales bacterium]
NVCTHPLVAIIATKIHTVRLSANMTRLLMLDPPTPTLRLNGKFRARQQSLTRRRPQWSSAADSGWDWLVDGGCRMSKTELPLRFCRPKLT